MKSQTTYEKKLKKYFTFSKSLDIVFTVSSQIDEIYNKKPFETTLRKFLLIKNQITKIYLKP